MEEKFFTIDLEPLLNSEFTEYVAFDGDLIGLDRKQKYNLPTKVVDLNPPQMNMFNKLIITKLPDGGAWVDFYSNKYAPTKELMEFMKYCTERWGLDKKRRGAPSQSDVPLLKSGNFERFWETVKIMQVKVAEYPSPIIFMRLVILNKDISEFMMNLKSDCEVKKKSEVKRDEKPINTPPQLRTESATLEKPIESSHNFISISGEEIGKDARLLTKPFTGGKIIMLIIISVIFNVLGSLGVLLYGSYLYAGGGAEVEWTQEKTDYKLDARYKYGVREVGKNRIKKKTSIYPTEEAKQINKRNGIIAMLIGGVFGIASILLYVFAAAR